MFDALQRRVQLLGIALIQTGRTVSIVVVKSATYGASRPNQVTYGLEVMRHGIPLLVQPACQASSPRDVPTETKILYLENDFLS